MKVLHFSRRFVLLFTCILGATARADRSVNLLMMHQIHSYQPAVLLSDGRVFIPDSLGSEIYDPKSDSFTAVGASGVCRSHDCAATLLQDGTVFIVGNSAAEIFDPGSSSFTSLGHVTCDNATVTLLPNGRLLIAGGCKDLRAELYDPVSQTFSFTEKMGSYRSDSVATLLGDGSVLITGGRTYEGKVLSTCEIYDLKEGAFVPIRSMGASRYGHAATLLADGRVLLTGKLPGEKGPSAELYDPGSGRFMATGQMIYGRTDHTASLLANGDILLAGGLGWSLRSPLKTLMIEDQDTVEVYHQATGRFSRVTPMKVRRSGHSATLLLDGHLLIAGGVHQRWYQLQERYEHTAELYLPRTTGSQRIVRPLFAWHSKSRLESSWILVSGSGFIAGDTLVVDGVAQPTTYISSALISAPFSKYGSAENPDVREVRVRYNVSGQLRVSEPVPWQAPTP